MAVAPWVVPDELWKRIEPLLPKVERRFRYPGRKRLPDRQALQGILFVLHTGIAWRHLPLELGFGGVRLQRTAHDHRVHVQSNRDDRDASGGDPALRADERLRVVLRADAEPTRDLLGNAACWTGVVVGRSRVGVRAVDVDDHVRPRCSPEVEVVGLSATLKAATLPPEGTSGREFSRSGRRRRPSGERRSRTSSTTAWRSTPRRSSSASSPAPARATGVRPMR
jgi:transposase